MHRGSDTDSRSAMLLGSMLAGQAFANAPVAAVHALAYPLGGHYHIPHGLSNSLVLPHVLRFNASEASELYAKIAVAILPKEEGKSSVNAAELTDRLIQYLIGLIEDVGLESKLRQVGVKEESLDMLAADAMLQQRLLVNNPREVTEADAREIYARAY